MFIYIDESGNSGNNLFDESQPVLYYATLYSPINLNKNNELIQKIRNLRSNFQVDRLHAKELGYKKLSEISELLKDLLIKYQIELKFHFIVKKDYIIIKFFDQVFDCGVNDAVPYLWYWTELRHILLLEIFNLFSFTNDDLLKKVWNALSEKDDGQSNTILVEICQILLEQVSKISDNRAREIISNSLKWAKNNPAEILFNSMSKKYGKNVSLNKQASPNIVIFQSVLFGIAEILKQKNEMADEIIVDVQTEFNNAQNVLMDWYQSISKAERISELETIDRNPISVFYGQLDKFSHIPPSNLKFVSGNENLGLELVDLYLWIFKRYFENKYLPYSLIELIEFVISRSENPFFGISLGMTQSKAKAFLVFLQSSKP
jgi:hypothetical protein